MFIIKNFFHFFILSYYLILISCANQSYISKESYIDSVILDHAKYKRINILMPSKYDDELVCLMVVSPKALKNILYDAKDKNIEENRENYYNSAKLFSSLFPTSSEAVISQIYNFNYYSKDELLAMSKAWTKEANNRGIVKDCNFLAVKKLSTILENTHNSEHIELKNLMHTAFKGRSTLIKKIENSMIPESTITVKKLDNNKQEKIKKDFIKTDNFLEYKNCYSSPVKDSFINLYNPKTLKLAYGWDSCIGKVTLITKPVKIVYYGEWKDGFFQGVGAIWLLNDAPKNNWYMPFKKKGDIYIGELKNNSILDGRGILIRSDGSAIKGIWRNDKIISGENILDYKSKFFSNSINKNFLIFNDYLNILNEEFESKVLPKFAKTEISPGQKNTIRQNNNTEVTFNKNKKEAFNDKFNPTISIAEAKQLNKKGIINGNVVDDYEVAEFYINDRLIVLDKDGNFKYEFFIPQNGIDLSLVAYDITGKKTESKIEFKRKTNENVYTYKLNPVKKEGRVNENALAIILGISDYLNVPEAKFADKDAEMFMQFSENILGIKSDNIKLLINEKASRTEITKAIKLWLKSKSYNNNNRELYVFYAGHGIVNPKNNELFLLPHDGDSRLLQDTALSMSFLYKEISGMNISNTIFFVDACFSGRTRNNKLLVAGSRPISIVSVDSKIPSNISVLTASSGDEYSSSLPEANHGLFSYSLMKGLEGLADDNNDKIITIKELYNFTKKMVIEESIRLGSKQSPQLLGNDKKVIAKIK